MDYDVGIIKQRRIISADECYFGSNPSGYRAIGAKFDTTNGLTRGAALTGAANSSKGLCSFWFRKTGSDGANEAIFSGNILGELDFEILHLTTNTLRFQGYDLGGAVFSCVSTSTFLTGGTAWKHVICNWDTTASQIFNLFVNDVNDSPTNTFSAVNPISWAGPTDWAVGERNGVTLPLAADIADLYVNSVDVLDISITANRRKFISSALKPVDLGADGSIPTGNKPICYFSGSIGSWPTNKGSGGGFTLSTGSLSSPTLVPTSPSD